MCIDCQRELYQQRVQRMEDLEKEVVGDRGHAVACRWAFHNMSTCRQEGDHWMTQKSSAQSQSRTAFQSDHSKFCGKWIEEAHTRSWPWDRQAMRKP